MCQTEVTLNEKNKTHSISMDQEWDSDVHFFHHLQYSSQSFNVKMKK